MPTSNKSNLSNKMSRRQLIQIPSPLVGDLRREEGSGHGYLVVGSNETLVKIASFNSYQFQLVIVSVTNQKRGGYVHDG
jgi:hypothetical protein